MNAGNVLQYIDKAIKREKTYNEHLDESYEDRVHCLHNDYRPGIYLADIHYLHEPHYM